MAVVAKALGDPIRLQLVDVLRKHAGKVCVCELIPLFDVGQSTVSHHLKVLRHAGLVDSERRGPVGLLLRPARRPRRVRGLGRRAPTGGMRVLTSPRSCGAPRADFDSDQSPPSAPPHGASDATRFARGRAEHDAGGGAMSTATSTRRFASGTRRRPEARHRRAASGCGEGGCCAPGEAVFGAGLYGANEQGELPEQAVLASLGCGNPTAVAELREGETVLDLGSGGGIDVLLSARRVGPTGKAYGVDMTEEMLALARRNAAEAGATNVEFLKGRIEEIPLAGGDRQRRHLQLRREPLARQGGRPPRDLRVLKAGGRIGISDVVAEDRPTRRAARRARRMGGLHRRRPVGGRVPAVPGRGAGSATWTSGSPTRWPTACTARS